MLQEYHIISASNFPTQSVIGVMLKNEFRLEHAVLDRKKDPKYDLDNVKTDHFYVNTNFDLLAQNYHPKDE